MIRASRSQPEVVRDGEGADAGIYRLQGGEDRILWRIGVSSGYLGLGRSQTIDGWENRHLIRIAATISINHKVRILAYAFVEDIHSPELDRGFPAVATAGALVMEYDYRRVIHSTFQPGFWILNAQSRSSPYMKNDRPGGPPAGSLSSHHHERADHGVHFGRLVGVQVGHVIPPKSSAFGEEFAQSQHPIERYLRARKTAATGQIQTAVLSNEFGAGHACFRM